MTHFFARETLETGCTISVEHTAEALHAHVELDGGVAIGPGDRVKVHGDAVRLPFGEAITLRRRATVSRAGVVQRELTKLRAWFDLTELYEVTFSPGHVA